jgi:hypothetical protein
VDEDDGVNGGDDGVNEDDGVDEDDEDDKMSWPNGNDDNEESILSDSEDHGPSADKKAKMAKGNNKRSMLTCSDYYRC